jgi:hypothetical protein
VVRLTIILVSTVAAVALGALILVATVLRPPPATSRLAGVTVSVAGYSVTDAAERKHRLDLSVRIVSTRSIDECMAFALDEPFAARRVSSADGTCVRPLAGDRLVALAFDKLTDDDIAFPAHTLVWGVAGGRCGLLLEAFGVCVVDQAGTAPLNLPSRSVIPSIGPIGSFLPIFSFEAP